MSSEPPEEPQLRSEPSVLSPASPKPLHFPAPTAIPVLEMQMDVGFNQTEPHMNDPAMRNTDVRPDFWRDPNEEQAQEEQQKPADSEATPYSTGGEGAEAEQGDEGAAATESAFSSTSPASNVAQNGIADEQQPTHTVDPSSDPSVPTADATSTHVAQDVSQSTDSAQFPNATSQPFDGGNLDVQALLDTLQTSPAAHAPNAASPNVGNTAPQAEGMTVATTYSPLQSQQQPALAPGVEADASLDGPPLSASALGAPPSGSGLPPRPPPQEQPLINPNYIHSQHIRDYHPHAAKPAFQPHVRSGSQGNVADPQGKNYVPPVLSPDNAGAAAGGQPTSFSPNGQQVMSPSQQPATPQQQYFSTPGYPNPQQQQQQMYAAQQSYGSTTSTPMESRRETRMREGQVARPEDRPWDGETQRKYDRFIEEERKYVSEGKWEQFPQGSRLFVGNLSSEKVTKRDIFHVFHLYGHLAQISIKQAYGFVQFLRTEDCMRALDAEQGTLIRDKKIHLEVSKPQRNRNQNQSQNQNTQRRSRSPPNRGRPGTNVDRYVSGSRGGGERNGYRPRSPSPRGYRDRYDDRYRARSRSPPNYNRGGGNRYRSPSPRRDAAEDDLPLPRRDFRDVPDVQILVLDPLDRDFISWVEQAFSSRSVRVDVLLLSPRLSEQAVVRRQIVEGVVAVVKLMRQNQDTGKIGLQIFDRRAGANNVKFEEYDGLEPNIAVELVLRAKSTYSAPQYGSYGAQQQQQPQQYPPPPQHQQYGAPYGQQPPNYQTPYSQPPPQLLTNHDPNNLQNILSAMNTPASAGSAQTLQNHPQLVGYLQQQQQSGGGGGGQVNMQDILSRLGNYSR